MDDFTRSYVDGVPAEQKHGWHTLSGAVMAAQSDLVEIVHRLRQIVNVKG